MNFPRNTFIQLANQEGRSPEFIENTLSYADKLLKQDLPVIFSLTHFGQIIGISIIDLKRIIENRGYHYSYYLIKKKSGGYRRIIAPHKNIKYLQDWIKLNILDKVSIHPSCTGFVKKRSILDNAKFHLDAKCVLNIDFENFFETITEKRVFGIFKFLGYHPNLAVEFAKICTVKMPEEKFEKLDDIAKEHFNEYFNLPDSRLIQGAPSSPLLANISCLKLDNRLSKLSNKLGVCYSRYADDMTFSGDPENLPSINILNKIITDEGFHINWNKVSKHKKGQKQIVTGLLINGTIRVTKKFKKDVLRHLYFCKKFGPAKHFEFIAPDKSYHKEWLIGKILFINSVEPDVAKKMFKIVKEINWEI